jgi:adenylate cyclase
MENRQTGGVTCNVGILFADVTGSTRIYELLGDQRGLAVINSCIGAALDATQTEGGAAVRTIGDELMAVFPTPSSALSAALAMQRRMEVLPVVPLEGRSFKAALRIGLHFGKAVKVQDDYFGDTVNVAARVVSLAKARQILTTGEVLDLLPAELQKLGQEIDNIAVKGRSEPLRIVQVDWSDWDESKTFFPGAPVRARLIGNHLNVSFGTRQWALGLGHPPFMFGRDVTNDVVIAGHHASRSHATIENRLDKWLLADHSTNGTYVATAGQEELRLHMETMILSGSGVISCGRPGIQADEPVRFSLV